METRAWAGEARCWCAAPPVASAAGHLVLSPAPGRQTRLGGGAATLPKAAQTSTFAPAPQTGRRRPQRRWWACPARRWQPAGTPPPHTGSAWTGRRWRRIGPAAAAAAACWQHEASASTGPALPPPEPSKYCTQSSEEVGATAGRRHTEACGPGLNEGWLQGWRHVTMLSKLIVIARARSGSSGSNGTCQVDTLADDDLAHAGVKGDV